VDDEEFVYFFHVDGFFRVPRKEWERIFSHFQRQTEAEHNQVVDIGGLHILGTERHEARRIDNQLRGRAGRQGDPGSSRFYLSLEDDLMRIFGSESHRRADAAPGHGRRRADRARHGHARHPARADAGGGQNFSVRKHLLEYDDVMNKQRESVYTLRREILEGKIHITEEELSDTRGYVLLTRGGPARRSDRAVHGQGQRPGGMGSRGVPARSLAGLRARPEGAGRTRSGTEEQRRDWGCLWAAAKASYEEKEALVGADLLRRVERDIMLQIVDTQWKDHLYSLDHLKEGIGLGGYGQRDPLVEYKKESFALFQDMKARIEDEIVRYIFWLRPVLNEDAVAAPRPAPRRAIATTTNNPGTETIPAFAGVARASASEPVAARQSSPVPARTGGDDVIKTVKRDMPKVGRNDPCPCGSGRKYKKCHGAGAS
jgi:preprotein translocase subunit SecA